MGLWGYNLLGYMGAKRMNIKMGLWGSIEWLREPSFVQPEPLKPQILPGLWTLLDVFPFVGF